MISFKEDHISQIPALLMLEKLGYTYLTPDEALALRYLKAGNDFYYNRAGELFLLHPGLADPEKILREGGFPMGYQPDLPSERALMASRDLLPEEIHPGQDTGNAILLLFHIQVFRYLLPQE